MRWPMIILGGVCLLAAAALLALPVVMKYQPQPEAVLPDLGATPAFSLTDQDGDMFESATLSGKVWVVDFVFTTCPAICPIMTTSMTRVQQAIQTRGLTDDARLISISIDPEHDTPEVLREYGERFAVDTSIWTLLTGEKETIWTLCREGFKLFVGEGEAGDAMPIAHDNKLILVDRAGNIRGYYDGTDAEAVNQLIADLPDLVREITP